jgi:hypothetical protein
VNEEQEQTEAEQADPAVQTEEADGETLVDPSDPAVEQTEVNGDDEEEEVG